MIGGFTGHYLLMAIGACSNIMKHNNTVKIYHHDTDCYNVVWHGSYFKWFEIGRVELSTVAGIDFKVLDEMGILLPVVNVNCRYKRPAKLFDEICISTSIKELRTTSITFLHTITNIENNVLILEADTTIVTTDRNGKLFRKMPEYLYNNYKKAIKNSECLTAESFK